jgi:hypothetical protein
MTEKEQFTNVLARKEIPGIFTAFLLENDIIEIEWDLDLMEVQKNHLVQLRDAIKELGHGKKMRVYISTNDLMNITPDARKYAVSHEGAQFTFANAVLVNNVAKKILFNFFVNIGKPKPPTKGFNSRQEALEWLNNLT